MIDPSQRHVVMLAVRGGAPRELDFIGSVQMVDRPYLHPVRCNHIHVLTVGCRQSLRGLAADRAATLALILVLDLSVPHAVPDVLRTILGRLRSVSSSLTLASFETDGFLGALLGLDNPVLEHRFSSSDRAIDRTPLDLNGFAVKANLLIDRRFDDIAADADPTVAHVALADPQLFLGNRNHLVGC